MTRIRTIKPEILADGKVAKLTSDAFRVFVAMIVLADDHGNMRAADEFLEGAVFWGRKIKPRMIDLLAELHDSPLIDVYETRGEIYAHLRGWEKHQRIDNPGKPRVPVPSSGFTFFYRKSDDIQSPGENFAGPRPRPRPRSLEHRTIEHRTEDHDLDQDQVPAHGARGLSAIDIESAPDPWEPEVERGSQPKPKRGPGRPRKDRPSVDGWQRVVDAYWLAFEAANGCKPNPSPRTLGELRTRIMQAGADEVIRRIGILFTDPPAWPQGPHDLTNLVGQHFDRFATPGSKASRSKQANRGSVIDAAPTDPVKYYEPNDWQKSLGPEWQPKDPETERREIDAWYAERDARDAAAKLPVEVPKTVMPDGSIRAGFTR